MNKNYSLKNLFKGIAQKTYKIGVFALVCGIGSNINGQVLPTYSFTSAGQTGPYGPNQGQINSAYFGSNLQGSVTCPSGIQYFTIPSSGTYSIVVAGAAGGNPNGYGGRGRVISGVVTLNGGTVLKVLVGQKGVWYNSSGGGGGSYVSTNGNVPIIVAGGGSGFETNIYSSIPSSDGNIANNGYGDSYYVTGGGTSGNGGNGPTYGYGGGGGGFYSNGTDANYCGNTHGVGFVNGGDGGNTCCCARGGFGGGGGTHGNTGGGGGGGGYSGGAGGTYYGQTTGGGGGSFFTPLMTNTTNLGLNYNDGYVTIVNVCSIEVPISNATFPPYDVVCSGKSATLTAAGGAPYMWFATPTSTTVLGSNASFITPTLTPGVYTYYVERFNFCGYASTRIPISVTVIPSPVVNIVGAPVAVCPGTTVGLAAFGANTYLWSNGVFNQTVIVTPTANTQYTVTGTTGICSSQAVKNVFVTPNISVAGTTLYCTGAGTTNLTASGAATYTWNTGSNSSFITVSPTVSTTYTVAGTLAGCTNSRTVSVLISNNPTVSITGSLSLCDGQSTTLTASGAAAYFWSNGANTAVAAVSPVSSTTVSVLGTNAEGCTGSTVTTLIVYTSPNITIAAPSRICVGEPVTLVANGGATYLWDNGATTSSITVTPGASTIYTVVATHTMNACTRTKTSNITLDPCTSVKTNQSNSTLALSVYPNPNNGMFTVELNNDSNKTIEVMDVTGRVLMTTKTKSEKSDFNISGLSNGIYFVRLSSDNNIRVVKIVKQ